MNRDAGSRPPRLGVHLAGDGIDIALLAPHATQVDLCLFDDQGSPSSERRVRLDGFRQGVFTGHVAGIRAGQRYGFRAHGPWEPTYGLRYNPNKLLVDPYARGLIGSLDYGPATYGHVVDQELRGDIHGPMDTRDSAGLVPLGVVMDRANGPDPAANRPWTDWSHTVIYEAHIAGLTKLAEFVPSELRGTYAGLAHPRVIDHLLRLGVTAVELLPIQAFVSEPHLAARGLTNYWGYSTLGFFAPHVGYATTAAQASGPAAIVAELRSTIHALHEAGIEVILDVVYNHTAEGGPGGQHLSWRGLDNALYYAHDGSMPATYADVTGTGNTLDFRRSEVVRMVLDSLRYWSDEFGIDGYRFDLAVTLGRGVGGFTPDHPVLVSAATDPSLHGLKLIAEPWDVGPGGWRTGQFGLPYAEWNDRFRDSVRSFWLADPGRAAHGLPGHRLRDLATRLSGSVDLFGLGTPPLIRGPQASINFVTSHDGFTLADLVTYEHKHNVDNGEQNRDGTDDNRSWNHGVEGPVVPDSPAADVLPLRRRSIRNLLATVVLSAGTPMIVAGDEMGRTQRGNNNAYCQDSNLSWLNWDDRSSWQLELLSTASHLLTMRREHPALRAEKFYSGTPVAPGGLADLAWYAPDGRPFDHARWHDPALRTFQMVRTAQPPVRDVALVCFNGSLHPEYVVLPPTPGDPWLLIWDSVWEHPQEQREAAIGGVLHLPGGVTITMEPLSMRVYVTR